MAVVSLGLLLLGAGCTSSGANPDDPVVIELGADAIAIAYAPELPDVALNPTATSAFDAIRAGMEERALPAPDAPDPWLTRAANMLAEHQREAGGDVSVRELEAALEVAGVYDSFVHFAVTPIRTAEELPPSPALLSDFLDISAERTANVFGVAWTGRDKGGGTLVLLSSYRVVNIEATPRQIDAERPLVLQGSILEEGAEINLVISTGQAATSNRISVPVRSDQEFRVEWPIPEGTTRFKAELVGVGKSWGRSFATMRFHTGAPPMDIATAAKVGAEAAPASAAEAQEAVLTEINQRRALLGLTNIQTDPGLDALAALDARVYAIGDRPEGSGDGIASRLKNWGVHTRAARRVYLEGNDLGILLDTIWYDPTQRRRLLDPETPFLGLAVIDNPPQSAKRYTLLAYAVAPTFEHSPTADLGEVTDAFNAKREAAGKQPLNIAPEIASVANRFAYPLIKTSKVDAKVYEAVVADLRKSGVKFDYVMVDIVAAAASKQLKFNKEVIDGEWENVGIAVARGPFAGSKTDVLVAVIVATR